MFPHSKQIGNIVIYAHEASYPFFVYLLKTLLPVETWRDYPISSELCLLDSYCSMGEVPSHTQLDMGLVLIISCTPIRQF
jgi:hypothetical protein